MRYLILAAITLTACAHNTPQKSAAYKLAKSLEGTFQTLPEDPDNNFIDRRMRIDALGEGEWIYYQLNTGADRKVYRQRVINMKSLPDGRVTQHAYTLNNPDDYTAMFESPKPITMDDISRGFDEGCEQIWTYKSGEWHGKVDHNSCIITSKRGGKIAIGAKARLTDKALYQGETGYSVDGTYRWGSKEGEWITLNRVTPAAK